MTWTVRIQSVGELVEPAVMIELFVEGIFAGLVAAGQRPELQYGDDMVDMAFLVATDRRAILLAKVLADGLQRQFPLVTFAVTITLDCRGGGAA